MATLPVDTPQELQDLFARRDCGPAEFDHMKELITTLAQSSADAVNAVLGSSEYGEWVRHHRKAIIAWNHGRR